MFSLWRILIDRLSYSALVTHSYLLRAAIVCYLSLATASRLLQLGLVISFHRVVAVRESRMMGGVAAVCLTTTAVHLLLEAATRQQLGLPHVARVAMYVWLSEGEYNPYCDNTGGTGVLLLPHVILLLVTNLAILITKVRDRGKDGRPLVDRYRRALVNSGANGRLTFSAYFILFLMLFFVIVIFPLFPRLLDTSPDRLPPLVWPVSLLFFWLGCGSFLADMEPRHFMLRRLRRALADWREEEPDRRPTLCIK